MFKKLLLIGLFVMGLVGVFRTEADAGCIDIGGSFFCADWLTGSEICSVSIRGGGNCTSGVDCPIVECSAFGRTDLGNGLCDPNTLDPDCGLTGTSFCINSAKKAAKAEGTSFELDQTLVQLLTKTSECELKGSRCLTMNTLDIADEDCPECCQNPGWILKTFTTPDFNAAACVCLGGVDNTQQCCADHRRTAAGACQSPTEPTCLAEHCTVDLTGYKPGTNIQYTCTPLP